MRKRWIVAFAVVLLLIVPFFTYVSPPGGLPSFSYFLENLDFTEETLTSIEWDITDHPNGDFTLESVVTKLGLRAQYLTYYEQDLEKAYLSGEPDYIKFAFHDFSERPIRIWIDDESFRIYSTGDDGHSKTGGLDTEDIWNGDPDKARAYIHKAYDDWRREQYQKNLWDYLFEKFQALEK